MVVIRFWWAKDASAEDAWEKRQNAPKTFSHQGVPGCLAQRPGPVISPKLASGRWCEKVLTHKTGCLMIERNFLWVKIYHRALLILHNSTATVHHIFFSLFSLFWESDREEKVSKATVDLNKVRILSSAEQKRNCVFFQLPSHFIHREPLLHRTTEEDGAIHDVCPGWYPCQIRSNCLNCTHNEWQKPLLLFIACFECTWLTTGCYVPHGGQ